MNYKPLYVRIFVVFLMFFMCQEVWGQQVRTIVLDAGHGGKDSGAKGRRVKEKDIALDVVLKLRDYLKENMKDVKVILTRDDDYFVELYRRAQIANQNKADLFISVHCNATKSRATYGSETFVMGLHKTEANLEVAKTENAAVLMEDNYVEKYDGFDPNSPEGTIFFSMMQNAFLNKSLDLASKVQHEMVDNLGMLNRGVKQAGFLVLYKTSMPSILVELGFVSNWDDETFLMSEDGKNKFAHSIYKAIVEYRNDTENRKGNDRLVVKTLNPVKNEKNEIEKKVEPIVEKPATPQDTNIENKPVTIVQTRVEENPLPQSFAAETVTFGVQFAAYPYDKSINDFKNLPDVFKYYQDKTYRFVSGTFNDIDSAAAHQKYVKRQGYKDAFVVSFKGTKRISLDEARELINKK